MFGFLLHLIRRVRAMGSIPRNTAARRVRIESAHSKDILAIGLIRILAHCLVAGPGVKSEPCPTKRNDESERA